MTKTYALFRNASLVAITNTEADLLDAIDEDMAENGVAPLSVLIGELRPVTLERKLVIGGAEKPKRARKPRRATTVVLDAAAPAPAPRLKRDGTPRAKPGRKPKATATANGTTPAPEALP